MKAVSISKASTHARRNVPAQVRQYPASPENPATSVTAKRRHHPDTIWHVSVPVKNSEDPEEKVRLAGVQTSAATTAVEAVTNTARTSTHVAVTREQLPKVWKCR